MLLQFYYPDFYQDRSKDVKTGGNKRPKASDTKKTNSANKKKLSNDDISPKTIDAEK